MRHISVKLGDSESEKAENDVKAMTMLLGPNKNDHVIAKGATQKCRQNRFLLRQKNRVTWPVLAADKNPRIYFKTIEP